MREGRRFNDYNFREYIIRRVRESFRDAKGVKVGVAMWLSVRALRCSGARQHRADFPMPFRVPVHGSGSQLASEGSIGAGSREAQPHRRQSLQ